MRIRSIAVRGFMGHDDAAVQLPDSGLVVVTGANGGGKSALMEAVAVAFWGKTLRGTDPWRDKSPGEVVVVTDEVVAHRRVAAGGGKKLDWSPCGAQVDSVKYETTAKAQAALETYVRDFELWRRTHVFSSQDAANFTMATDSERKALLENLLGLGVFDRAAARAAVERAAARDDEKRARASLEAAEAVLVAREETLSRLKQAPMEPELPKPDSAWDAALSGVLHEKIAKLSFDIAELVAARREAVLRSLDRVKAARSELVDAQVVFKEAGRAHSRCVSGACPTCGQAWPGSDDADALLARVEVVQAEVVEAQEALLAVEGLARDEEAEIEAAAANLRADHARALRELEHLERAKAADEQWQAMDKARVARNLQRARLLAEVQVDASVAANDVARSRAIVDRTARAALVADLACKVLGVQGVRAAVLGSALEGLEEVANFWLNRVGKPGMRVQVRPCTERKSGAVVEAISLEVLGAGGGRGYKAASGGERRRVDAALLLALAEVASAASGAPPGTLWLDEVFDALDEDGVDAVADALGDLARDRAVVLITHSDLIARALSGAQRISVPRDLPRSGL